MKNKMKRNILITAGLAIVAAFVILALKPFGKKDLSVTFETVKVERGMITNAVTATGTIEAITTVEIGTQVSGIIENVYVDFNDNVRQGQVLAKLDQTSLRAQLEQSQSGVDQAQAQFKFQEATYNRLKQLYEKDLIAQADYDQAVFNYENSRAALNNARSALTRAKVNLEYATIFSPINGVVLNRAVEEGQTVAASFNTPTLFTIVNDLTRMEVQTSVDEADIGNVKEGQRVEFTVDAYPDLKFDGAVSQVRLQPVITNNVVTYVVIISASNPEKKLMPGMTASTTIYVEEKENTLFLSGKALRFTPDQAWMAKMVKERGLPGSPGPDSPTFAGKNPDGNRMMSGSSPTEAMTRLSGAANNSKRVWVKDENGQVRPARITTGIDNGTNVEVLSGIDEDMEVVVSMNTGTGKVVAATANKMPRGPLPF